MKQWKELRNNYYDTHPLCEVCNAHGMIIAAEEVHHKTPFLSGETNEDKVNLLLDYENLMSVCKQCHTALHIKRDRYKMKRVDYLTNTEYNKAHNLFTLNE